MTPVQTASGEPKTMLAIAGGMAAGLLTLAIVAGGLFAASRSADADAVASNGEDPRLGTPVGAAALSVGDCIDFNRGSTAQAQFTVTGCTAPHVAEVTAKVEHPDAGSAYPGADAMGDWIAGRCQAAAEDYIGSPLLETTLTDGAIIPDFDAWSNGNHQTACYLTNGDSSPLTESTSENGDQYPRGDLVAVSRLIPGDCFVPSDGENSYDLNSNSTVMLVSCDSGYNGVFFGRDTLDAPLGTLFPGEEAVGETTSRRCAELFGDHFGVPASGFNYRYWRPNQQSWDLDDRDLLCSVLDDNELEEEFDPSLHQQFFELAVGACFNLGPEETSDSLRLDDQVRVLPCTEPHVGQMIGSGNLEQDLTEPFPPDDGVLQLAGTECEQLFETFVGISPYQSDLGNFPFWYPNQPGWQDGDRRFACAFLDDAPRSESLEGAEEA